MPGLGAACHGYESAGRRKCCKLWRVHINAVKLTYAAGSECYIRNDSMGGGGLNRAALPTLWPTGPGKGLGPNGGIDGDNDDFEVFQDRACRTADGEMGSDWTGEYDLFNEVYHVGTCEAICRSIRTN